MYELLEALPSSSRPTGTEIPHSVHTVTAGLPTYNGTGALDINFTREFAQKYVDAIKSLGDTLIDREKNINKYDDYVEKLPGIYMCCGTEDFLLENNRELHRFLESEGIPHEYHESKGNHDMVFWHEYIAKIVEWMFG